MRYVTVALLVACRAHEYAPDPVVVVDAEAPPPQAVPDVVTSAPVTPDASTDSGVVTFACGSVRCAPGTYCVMKSGGIYNAKTKTLLHDESCSELPAACRGSTAPCACMQGIDIPVACEHGHPVLRISLP